MGFVLYTIAKNQECISKSLFLKHCSDNSGKRSQGNTQKVTQPVAVFKR